MSSIDNFCDRARSPLEISKFMSTHRRFVLDQINNGNLRAVRFGPKLLRVMPDDLSAWLTKHSTTMKD
jgi:excisionase family DNA binding protein